MFHAFVETEAICRIIELLKTRRQWNAIGMILQQAKKDGLHYPLAGRYFGTTGNELKKYKFLFTHLKREKGLLKYK